MKKSCQKVGQRGEEGRLWMRTSLFVAFDPDHGGLASHALRLAPYSAVAYKYLARLRRPGNLNTHRHTETQSLHTEVPASGIAVCKILPINDAAAKEDGCAASTMRVA